MPRFIFHSQFRSLDVGTIASFVNGQFVTEDPAVAEKLRGIPGIAEVTPKEDEAPPAPPHQVPVVQGMRTANKEAVDKGGEASSKKGARK